jgi:hypothetical protein
MQSPPTTWVITKFSPSPFVPQQRRKKELFPISPLNIPPPAVVSPVVPPSPVCARSLDSDDDEEKKASKKRKRSFLEEYEDTHGEVVFKKNAIQDPAQLALILDILYRNMKDLRAQFYAVKNQWKESMDRVQLLLDEKAVE